MQSKTKIYNERAVIDALSDEEIETVLTYQKEGLRALLEEVDDTPDTVVENVEFYSDVETTFTGNNLQDWEEFITQAIETDSVMSYTGFEIEFIFYNGKNQKYTAIWSAWDETLEIAIGTTVLFRVTLTMKEISSFTPVWGQLQKVTVTYTLEGETEITRLERVIITEFLRNQNVKEELLQLAFETCIEQYIQMYCRELCDPVQGIDVILSEDYTAKDFIQYYLFQE